MYWRTASFANLGLKKPAAYIDTDMLFVLPFDPAAILAERDIVFCRRSFNRESPFNGEQFEGKFKKYDQVPLGVLWPFMGCMTITKTFHSWKCLSILMSLMDENHKKWYGDQEALKIYSHMLEPERVGQVEELDYACLPDMVPDGHVPHVMHYKGERRKEAFLNA